LTAVALIPFLIKIVPYIYYTIKEYIGWILVFIVIFMILRSKELNKIFWTMVVFFFAGVLGIIAFSLNLKEPLLPMFSGLFGSSMLIKSIINNTKIPTQQVTDMIKISRINLLKSIILSTLSAIIITIFPGLGPAQAAVLATQLVRKIGVYSYIVLIGGINSVSMLASLLTLYTIDKARNGTIVVIQKLIELDFDVFVFLIVILVISAGIATILCLSIAKRFSYLINKINYRMLCVVVLTIISVVVFTFSGILGFVVFIVSTFIGIIPSELNVARSTLMASILLPIMFWYIL